MRHLLRDVSLRCNITLLRYAADRLHQERVAAASSLREIASGVGTSTRAGYSLSGSKEGLLGTLDAPPMEMLHQWVDAMAVSPGRAGPSSGGVLHPAVYRVLPFSTTASF